MQRPTYAGHMKKAGQEQPATWCGRGEGLKGMRSVTLGH